MLETRRQIEHDLILPLRLIGRLAERVMCETHFFLRRVRRRRPESTHRRKSGSPEVSVTQVRDSRKQSTATTLLARVVVATTSTS